MIFARQNGIAKEKMGIPTLSINRFRSSSGVRERRSTAAVQTLREIWRAFGGRGAFGLRRLQRRFPMVTPSWVKTNGKYLKCNPLSKIPNWNLEAATSFAVLNARLIFSGKAKKATALQ
jgi:hypothetical protein